MVGDDRVLAGGWYVVAAAGEAFQGRDAFRIIVALLHNIYIIVTLYTYKK